MPLSAGVERGDLPCDRIGLLIRGYAASLRGFFKVPPLDTPRFSVIILLYYGILVKRP